MKIMKYTTLNGTKITMPEWAMNKRLIVSAEDTGEEQPAPVFKMPDKGDGFIYLKTPPWLFSLRIDEGKHLRDSHLEDRRVDVVMFCDAAEFLRGGRDAVSTSEGVHAWNWQCTKRAVINSDIFVWRWKNWDDFFKWIEWRGEEGFFYVLTPHEDFLDMKAEAPSNEFNILRLLNEGDITLNTLNETDMFPETVEDESIGRGSMWRNYPHLKNLAVDVTKIRPEV